MIEGEKKVTEKEKKNPEKDGFSSQVIKRTELQKTASVQSDHR